MKRVPRERVNESNVDRTRGLYRAENVFLLCVVFAGLFSPPLVDARGGITRS